MDKRGRCVMTCSCRMFDKHIEEQREQRDIINSICSPYSAAELQELVTEAEEVIMSNVKRGK